MVFEYARIVNQTSKRYKYPISYKLSPDPELQTKDHGIDSPRISPASQMAALMQLDPMVL